MQALNDYIVKRRAHVFAMPNYKLIDPGYEALPLLESQWARQFWLEEYPKLLFKEKEE